MALLKTIAAVLLIGLALWTVVTVIEVLAATISTIFEFLIIAAVVGTLDHRFKHKHTKAH